MIPDNFTKNVQNEPKNLSPNTKTKNSLASEHLKPQQT
jgi:hypothetical protein